MRTAHRNRCETVSKAALSPTSLRRIPVGAAVEVVR